MVVYSQSIFSNWLCFQVFRQDRGRCMNSEKIKGYCEEALSITELQGVQDGLAFLIGEKFALLYYQLKTAHNKLKFLYPDSVHENQTNSIPQGNRALQLSYTLTINENYKRVFEQVDKLEEVLDHFIEEIRDSFLIQDIQDYLSSYPRLSFKETAPSDEMDFLEESPTMTAQDIFSEVEDILIVDEMKKLFT